MESSSSFRSTRFLSVAAQLPIHIFNTTAAIVPVIQLAPNPAAITVLALGAKHVPANVDVAAALGKRSCGHNPSASPRAFQAAIVIDDLAHAAVIAIECAGDPVAICGFADGRQVVATGANFAATLCI